MQRASSSPVLDRKRLAAVLELLSSDKDGERQAAAEAAHRLIRNAGLRWADILGPPSTEPPPIAPPPRARKSPPWRSLLAECHAHPDRFSEWELQFLASVGQQRRISKKQYAILARLAGRVRT
jgi:hypothetical protein